MESKKEDKLLNKCPRCGLRNGYFTQKEFVCRSCDLRKKKEGIK